MLNKFMERIDRITARWPWTRTAVCVLMLVILARQLSRPFMLDETTFIDWASFAFFALLGSCFIGLEYFMRIVSPRMDRARRSNFQNLPIRK
ncbi:MULTISPECIES: hypothetical protein [Pseudomonas]|uniref:hypothetical protein n=1 Tax=Pseudomonas TaxID=286 RepID=UPI00290A01BB|nr:MULTISPECIES: hypothetical protein [Pseudomonas]MDU8545701.1 hypothetical protein [Pseudomonas syringae group sp. J248-6]WPP02628.1 hypothetical protein SFA35_26375 [Pseudomonas sp. HR96]